MMAFNEGNKRKFLVNDEHTAPNKKLKPHDVVEITKDGHNLLQDTTGVSLNRTINNRNCPFESLPTEITSDIIMSYFGLHNLIDVLQLSQVSKHFHEIVTNIARHLTVSLRYQYHHNPLSRLHSHESDISVLVRHVHYNKKVSIGLMEIKYFFNQCFDDMNSISEKERIHHLLHKSLELLAIKCASSLEEKKLYLCGKLGGYSFKFAKEHLSSTSSEDVSRNNEYHDIYQRSCLVMQVFLLQKSRLHKYTAAKQVDNKIVNQRFAIDKIDISRVVSNLHRSQKFIM